MLSPGETIGFDSLIANQNKNIFYDYTTGELVINSTGNFLASWWVGIGSAAGSTPSRRTANAKSQNFRE